MARTRRDDERLLSKEEQDLIVQTRHPLVKQLSNTDLSELLKSLRTCRDRAHVKLANSGDENCEAML